MRVWKRVRLAGLLVALPAVAALVWTAQPAPRAQAKSHTPSFTNYQLGTQYIGESCPNTTAPCTNGAAEPAIISDPAGNYFGSSENGLGGGTEAWKSTDGGLHYTTLASPNAASQTSQPTVAPGGGDTAVATATARNANGLYNVYVASLSLANVDVSTSTDGGNSWSLNPTGATIPGDDREWIAADGASKVCISYHDAAVYSIHVNCSTDAGTTFTQLSDAFDTNHAYNNDNNEIGNLVIDPVSHDIYQTFSGIDSSDAVNCTTSTNGCGYHVVYMAVSTDGGATFTDYPVYDNPNHNVSYGHQFVNVSLDSAGNVYSVYSDNHNLFYSYSTNHGQTWSAPRQINSGASATAIMPWSVAGQAGHLDVVWYGTSYYDGVNPPDNYPASANWYVYMAQNLSATSGGGFTQVQATPLIHTGGVCESGVSCTGNRDLYDDFGVTASPSTGLASIIYSDDQYDPAQPTRCTQAQSSTSSCNHTAIATQTGGNGI
ncbi:MAG TPA: sialidase family protein [Ktedonobacterales bacterium]